MLGKERKKREERGQDVNKDIKGKKIENGYPSIMRPYLPSFVSRIQMSLTIHLSFLPSLSSLSSLSLLSPCRE